VSSADLAETIESLLSEAERQEPVSFRLGTPVLPEGGAVRRLVELGAEAVPHLVEATRREDSSRRLAYVALALGRIGDPSAAGPLRELRARCRRRPPRDEWDHAVVGQCNVAIDRLGADPRS
jgi:hypothetical protein